MHMNRIVVSVIVPVYKIEEALLRRCLQSLCEQTEKNAEFIIVDDGSPDNCGEIIDEYSATDDRFVPVHTSNQGVSNARNIGIEKARGEYIIFVDGDDYVEADVCEKNARAMNDIGTDVLFFLHLSTNEDNDTVKFDESVQRIDDSLMNKLTVGVVSQENPIEGVWAGPPWGKVFRKSIINDNNLRFVLGLRKSQDRVFMLDYLLCCKTAAVFNYMGYHYVINEDSVCQRYNSDITGILEMAASEMEERISKSNKKTAFEEAVYSMYMIFFCEIMLLDFFHPNNPNTFRKCYKMMKKSLKEKKHFYEGVRKGALQVISRKRRLIVLALRCRCYFMAAVLAKILF